VSGGSFLLSATWLNAKKNYESEIKLRP